MFKMRNQVPFLSCVMTLLLMAVLAQVRAQEQAFPNAFRHEATRVQGLSTETRPATAEPVPDAVSPLDEWSPDSQGLAEVLPRDLRREVFEEVLKVNFYGTYVFYSRLSEEDQRQVYTAYTQAGSIDAVRADVMQRSRLRHKLR